MPGLSSLLAAPGLPKANIAVCMSSEQWPLTTYESRTACNMNWPAKSYHSDVGCHSSLRPARAAVSSMNTGRIWSSVGRSGSSKRSKVKDEGRCRSDARLWRAALTVSSVMVWLEFTCSFLVLCTVDHSLARSMFCCFSCRRDSSLVQVWVGWYRWVNRRTNCKSLERKATTLLSLEPLCFWERNDLHSVKSVPEDSNSRNATHPQSW